MERGTANAPVIIAITIAIALVIIFGYVLFNSQNEQKSEKGESLIDHWIVYVDGKKTSVINAHTTSSGTAVWSGRVRIEVFNQSNAPMEGVKIILNGCGITSGNVTNSSGVAEFFLKNVSLPSGISTGEIHITLIENTSGGEYRKTDSIMVIRKQ